MPANPVIDEFASSGSPWWTQYRKRIRGFVSTSPPPEGVVLIRHDAGQVEFPPVCVNCGSEARSRIAVQRAFSFLVHEGSTNKMIHPIEQFNAAFCSACVARHISEQKVSGITTVIARLLGEGSGLGALIALGTGLMFLKSALERLSIVPAVIGALPLTVGSLLLLSAWKRNRYRSVPAPTSVDSAIAFTPVLSTGGEPAWRAYAFRLPLAAEAFRQANVKRLWQPGATE